MPGGAAGVLYLGAAQALFAGVKQNIHLVGWDCALDNAQAEVGVVDEIIGLELSLHAVGFGLSLIFLFHFALPLFIPLLSQLLSFLFFGRRAFLALGGRFFVFRG